MPPNRALCSVTQEPVSIGGQIICDHRIAKIRPFGSRRDPGRRAVIGGFLSKRPSDHKISCSLALPSMPGSAGNWSSRRGRPTGPPTGHRMSSGEDWCGHADEFIRPPVPQNLLGTRRPLRKIRRRFDPDPVRGCGIDRQAIGRRGKAFVQGCTGLLQRRLPGRENHPRRQRTTGELWDQGVGAGEGNRTLVFSLEGCCSTIELHPHALLIGWWGK